MNFKDNLYTFDNPCDQMKLLTEKRKMMILKRKHRNNICPITQKSYERCKKNENEYSFDICCSECNLLFKHFNIRKSKKNYFYKYNIWIL